MLSNGRPTEKDKKVVRSVLDEMTAEHLQSHIDMFSEKRSNLVSLTPAKMKAEFSPLSRNLCRTQTAGSLTLPSIRSRWAFPITFRLSRSRWTSTRASITANPSNSYSTSAFPAKPSSIAYLDRATPQVKDLENNKLKSPAEFERATSSCSKTP